MLGFLTGVGGGGTESGSGLRAPESGSGLRAPESGRGLRGLATGHTDVPSMVAGCVAGDVEIVNGAGLWFRRAGDADSFLGAGELRVGAAFARAGLGGELRIAANLGPPTLSLIIFRGGPSELRELDILSGG